MSLKFSGWLACACVIALATLSQAHAQSGWDKRIPPEVVQWMDAATKARSAEESAALWRKALEAQEKFPSDTIATEATILFGLGDALIGARKFAEAETVRLRLLALQEKTFGPSQSVVETLTLLASDANNQRRYAEAESYGRRGVEMSEQLFGPDHREVAPPAREYGRALYHQKKLSEAEPVQRRTLAIRESVSLDNAAVGQVANDLGMTLHDLKRHPEAAAMFQRAYEIKLKQYGTENLSTAYAAYVLALELTILGKNAEANPLADLAVTIRRKILGPNSETTRRAESLSQLIRRRMQQGEPASPPAEAQSPYSL